MAVVLMAVGAATGVQAATTTAPKPKLALRPLTPSDIADYKLTGIEGASGMSTVPVGQPVYLEALINNTVSASDIVGVAWELTAQPIGSTVTLTNSPLGTNVPIYHPADRVFFQVAGRSLLRPDLRGQYSVKVTVTTAGTNAPITLTQNITAGVYMGINTCELCHSGGVIAENMVAKWSQTLHASKLSRSIDGLAGSYNKNCISCHTVGYDVNPLAENGGFDDIAKQTGWTFPTNLAAGNFAAMPAKLQNVANIQCENCHGPGSEHAYNLGDTNRISVTFNAGNCGQCHDAKTHHNKNPEWNNSKHAIATTAPTGAGREGCVGCHSAIAFADRLKGETAVNTTYEAISCAACHDPHNATNPHQLRTVADVQLLDGITTVTDAGTAALCMDCHKARRNSTNYVEVTAGGSSFGPHEAPQTDMLMGANAITYGKAIPSSAHREVVEESCVHCHMQPREAADPGWLHAGGHTFSMKYDSGTNVVELTEACVACHGEIEEFNFARQDYDGNGVLQGVQDEVKGLLNQLGQLLPPVGQPKDDINITSTWTKQQLKAAYNYRFVQRDGSLGIHNLSYAVGILKASIADMTGDANTDGLPDAWQTQYFGSTSSANAAASACPAGDGVPNWLKYSLGLDPTVKGINVEGGVVWANGKGVVNPGGTNTVAIYTAAEVAFDTEVGKTYQLQAISSLGGGWSNVGAPIVGTGSQMSYVTPTRANVQQFYRVATTTP